MNPFTAIRSALRRVARRIDKRNRFVREDFVDGGNTLVQYIRTHRMKYQRHVGAHFIVALHRKSETALAEFAEKKRVHGWHFPLNAAEEAAMIEARDRTSADVRIANLRYGRNVWDQLANTKQLMRAIGLGAVASTAVIAVPLTEFMLFAREALKRMVENTFGVTILDNTSAAEADQFVALANNITAETMRDDGTLDPDLVADRIATLVHALEQSENVEAAVNATVGDYTYLIGVVSGIAFLVIGRGLAKLVAEGFSGAVSKIDAFVHDMDDYCEFVLGRSPFPPAAHEGIVRRIDEEAAQAGRSSSTPVRAIPAERPEMDYAPGATPKDPA